MPYQQKINLLDLDSSKLTQKISELALPVFTTKQIYQWIFQKHVLDFDLMTNISQKNRLILKQHFQINNIKDQKKITDQDNTQKYTLTLEDNHKIEMVSLPEKKYHTLCVSSQCGCPLNCQYCVTGLTGFQRDLKRSEILLQLLLALQDNQNINHIVFMGMGEPLLNVNQVLNAIKDITNPQKFNFSKRKITVSTSGIITGIQTLIQKNISLNLAISIGHPVAEKRRFIMPVEKNNPLKKIIPLLKEYLKIHNRKLTLEYTLLKGFNDQETTISELVNIAKFLSAKINLINLNPHPLIKYQPISGPEIIKIKKYIENQRVSVTIRYKKGHKINAGCGQLATSKDR
ncbi:23S rRNA (adenine(2503)-C(2))-methyltransferase RlmN [bacterium]|nr:23S rRNA (adenine(2503)-C(2))-methyltransferase RlmN [bacterium]